MPPGAASFRHVILGLLMRRPMSGYDIKRNLKSLDWLIGSPSSGSLYPVLRTLLQDGCATVEVRSRRNRPPRKIYSITEAGRQEVQDWIDRPGAPDAALRPFLMRLVLADAHPPVTLASHLVQRRAQVVARQAALEQIVLVRGNDRPAHDLAPDYGLALAVAEISWLDKTLGQLALLVQEQSPVEVIELDGARSPV